MSTTVLIPTPLRPYTDDQRIVHAEGTTVGDVLASLLARHQGLRPHLVADDGRLRSFVNVYVNDTDIRYLAREQTPVEANDVISIVPSVAGGAGALEDSTVPELPSLSAAEVQRYSRHLIMPEVGLEGQRRLKAARVLCVGVGGLGSPAAIYLTAAGAGTIGLVDFDVVDFSNLQRQILFGTADVGRSKLAAAEERLRAVNPDVRIIKHETALTSANALDIIRDYDLVVDGADNFPTRYLVNDACVLLGKPNAYGSIFRFEGQVSVFAAPGGPCYRCLYPEPPPPGLVPSCAEGGVLGVLPGIIGTIQASEAIKLITRAGHSLAGRLLLFDALTMDVRVLTLQRDPSCPVCGDHPSIRALIDYHAFCGVTAPGAAASPALPPEWQTGVDDLKARLDRRDDLWILDVRESREFEICRIPGSTLIPLGQLATRLAEVPAGPGAPDIVVHCKAGGRSAKAVRLLRDAGYSRATNLTGGILEWIAKIDPSLTGY